jgi:pimeloyl-ACP methyl ester carboxylesterase
MKCFYAAALIPGAGKAWWAMLELIAKPGTRADLIYAFIPRLPDIDCPVLFCWGDHHMAAPAAGIEFSRHLKTRDSKSSTAPASSPGSTNR